jgi:predicted RNase H-like HicB family nuclease/predicted RNA binding protein YcfA (HicA-like mRNA interferase family)
MRNLVDKNFGCIYIFTLTVVMTQPETSRNQVVARLTRDGWVGRHGGDHDVYKHPAKPGRIIVPRHRTLSPGVARAIAKAAGWQGS